MEKKQIDWEERHFQIVLAILNRTDGNYTLPGFNKVISRADELVGLLKERETELDNLQDEQNKEISQK